MGQYIKQTYVQLLFAIGPRKCKTFVISRQAKTIQRGLLMTVYCGILLSSRHTNPAATGHYKAIMMIVTMAPDR